MKNKIAYHILNWIVDAMSALRYGPRPSETYNQAQLKMGLDCIMHDARFFLSLLEKDSEERELLLTGFTPKCNSLGSTELNHSTAQCIHLITSELDRQEDESLGIVHMDNPLGTPSQWLGGMYQSYDSLPRLMDETRMHGLSATAGMAWALNFAHAKIQEMLEKSFERAESKRSTISDGFDKLQ